MDELAFKVALAESKFHFDVVSNTLIAYIRAMTECDKESALRLASILCAETHRMMVADRKRDVVVQ